MCLLLHDNNHYHDSKLNDKLNDKLNNKLNNKLNDKLNDYIEQLKWHNIDNYIIITMWPM
jgi:hypothetical protein